MLRPFGARNDGFGGPLKLINTSELFKEACEAIARAPYACVDTEADSLHHYVEKLCLIQVGTADEDFVIDPLSPLDLRPLVEILSQKPLTMHGADFDIRILHRFYGFVPVEVFDTLLAAQLLGYEKQGLADLALKHCGVSLPKAGQKADWSIRPLAPELITYAANDTHYLDAIRRCLEAELRELGRIDWQRQYCQKLVRTTTTAKEEKSDTENEWQIKGSKKLNSKALTLLKTLWNWREEEAKRKDRPRFKVMHSEDLIQMAQWAEANPGADIAKMPNANRSIRQTSRDILNRLIEESRHRPPTEFVENKKNLKRGKRWSNKEETLMTAMKEERLKIAQELKINASVLATNAVLEALALNPPENKDGWERVDGLLPWQAGILAERFEKIWYNNRHAEH